MNLEYATFRPQKMTLSAAIVISLLLAGLLLSVNHASGGVAQAASVQSSPTATQSAAVADISRIVQGTLGSAFLDLNLLAEQNSIDEADNARWSLVRDSSIESQVYSIASGVDWATLRRITFSGSFRIPPGATWSFNQVFQEGYGYKIASGVLAGGHCALATVFRSAAMHAGLPTYARVHRWEIPGFPLSETVNIWWGRDDLTIENSFNQPLDLAWSLSSEGIEVSVMLVQ
jgi:hypothetical protein